MPSFKLKPEHIKIMTDLNFRISILIDSKDRYRPAIDVKRPFGNSGPTTNVCESWDGTAMKKLENTLLRILKKPKCSLSSFRLLCRS